MSDPTPSLQLLERERLKAFGNANVERLLTMWGISYKWVNNHELDFLNPVRNDNNFGSCRFNRTKGIGADFVGSSLRHMDYSSFGPGYDASDFDVPTTAEMNATFDIIGLCKLVHGYATYHEAFDHLVFDLAELNKIQKLSVDKIIIDRELDIKKKQEEKKQFARRILSSCINYRGTLGEKYLNSRAIHLSKHADIYYHSKVYNSTAKTFFPAIIFPIRALPNTEIVGAHRIYMAQDGAGKAPIATPKMAIGELKNNALWFGDEMAETLYIAEGPENALTIYQNGAALVACAINAGNMPNVQIPPLVTKIVLCGDRDRAGLLAIKAGLNAYKKLNVSVLLPPEKKLKNGKYADFNDIARGT